MEIYTLKEVAGFLKVHPKTLHSIISSEQLRSIWVGGQHRIKENDLREYLGVGPDESLNIEPMPRRHLKPPAM